MLIDLDAQEEQKIRDAAQGFIPMSGMAVVCDLYVPMPGNASKTQRARVPYDALTWLLKRLEEQGATQDALMKQQQAVIAQTAQSLLQNSPSQPQMGGAEANPLQPPINSP